MGNILKYKGYYTKIEYDARDGILHGKIEGITDLIDFESESAEDIQDAFREAVDDYLDFCDQVGKCPDKTYSGTFNVRMESDMHRQLALEALRKDTSLNSVIVEACKNHLSKNNVSINVGITTNTNVVNNYFEQTEVASKDRVPSNIQALQKEVVPA